MIETKQYIRKPFTVDAVQVTAENIAEVAEWCSGTIRTAKNPKTGEEEKYIKVWVHRILEERQSKAFFGDWVLYAGTGFKVYTTSAFEKSFELDKGPITVVDENGNKIVPAAQFSEDFKAVK